MKKKKKTIVVTFKLRRKQPFFSFVKGILRCFYKKPKIINLAGQLKEKSIIIPNHCHKKGPLMYELHYPVFHTLWGAHQMLGNFKSRQNYLRDVFYIQKRGFSKCRASFLAGFEACFSQFFYKGMRVLPTFTDGRLKDTINKSIDFLNQGVSVMIFPEDSSTGYHDVLTQLFPGFVLLAERYFKKTGEDLPIYPVYYHTKKKVIVIDKPHYVQDLKKQGLDRNGIAQFFLTKINDLHTMIEENKI